MKKRYYLRGLGIGIFLTALIMGLAKGEQIADAVRFGSTAASIACTKMGAQPSIPTKEEVENFTSK